MLPPQQPFGGRIQPAHPEGDSAIRATDSDAALARFSAVQKGWLNDPFIKPLAPRGAHLQPPRPPLINYGTYLRSEGVDKLVNEWLELSAKEGKQCQIVSLGAGSDTRYWRIASGPHKEWLAAYIEIDFEENTTKKAMAIRKSRELSALLGDPTTVKLAQGGTALLAPTYHLLPADMRKAPQEAIGPLLANENDGLAPLLSPSLPTLLLFECVLAYMTPAASEALIQWFVDYFASTQENVALGGIVYEMFGLDDSFGKVMLNNLKARNVTLPGVVPYISRDSLPSRFTRHGFTASHALTLRDIRKIRVSSDELERISQLEMLDELEELDLVLEHYAITWGVKVFGSSVQADWGRWGTQ